jgi:hypothetical protein
MLSTDQTKRKAQQTLVSLATIGAQWIHPDSPIAYLSIETMPRLSGQKVLKFARLVRDATVLERSGTLVANIDRMGNVTGWHLSRR